MTHFKSTVLALFVVFTFSNCQIQNFKKINGNGKISTITRTVADYDKVLLSGSMDFILEKGTEGKITIEGESNLLEYILTETKDGNLIIKQKNNYNLNSSNHKTIKITIPFQEISSVTLSGSGDVLTKNRIKTEKFASIISGSGDVVLDIIAKNTIVKVTGSGDITLKGKTIQLNASVTGSGDFNGKNLEANNTDVKITGSGGMHIVANNSLKARVTGSGDIKYTGNPTHIDKKVTGSGRINN